MFALAALSLSGCNWFSGKSRTLQADGWIKRQPDQIQYGRDQLAEGRKALDRGDDLAAIIAFSNVQRIAQFAADAHNGMAIGYARVGRPDLAERYFRQAVLEAPDEPRFLNNLAMLHRSQQGAATKALASTGITPSSAASLAAVAAPAGRAVMPGIRVEQPRSRLVRSGNGEFTLSTQAAPRDERQVRMTRADR